MTGNGIRLMLNKLVNVFRCDIPDKSDVFFQGQTLFWPYLRNVWSDWCETKRKCIVWVSYVILTFDLTHDLDLGCSKVKFRNSCITGIVGLIDCEMKGKRINRILGWLYDFALWPHPWPWPWSFKVWVLNSLISGMGRPIDMKRKGCESFIHDHDIDQWDQGGVGGCTG